MADTASSATNAQSPRRRRRPAPIARMNEIIPPEGVPLHFEVAGIGARLGAQAIDFGLSAIFLIALVIVSSQFLPMAAMWSLMALSFFAIRTPTTSQPS